MTATIEYRITEIYRIRPSLRNARTHSPKQVDQIVASIEAPGMAASAQPRSCG
jgi:hypothetical protein